MNALVGHWALLVRVLPLGIALARLTRGLVPWPVALALVLALAQGLSAGSPSAPPVAGAGLISRLLREFCLGCLTALACVLPVAAAAWSVRLSERAAALSPLRPGPLATIYGLGASFLALSLGGHRSLVIGLNASLVDAPLGATGFDRSAFALGIVRLVFDALALSVAWGLPLLLAFLMLDASLALSARVFGPRATDAARAPLRGPLLVLLAALLAMPIVSQVPEALRGGLSLARELTRNAAN